MAEARHDASRTVLQSFCEDAARQVLGLEVRLRTMLAAAAPHGEARLLAESLGGSLRLTTRLLRAARRGEHAALLAARPLLRAMSAERQPSSRARARIDRPGDHDHWPLIG